jgi:hypothetical protein
MPQEMDSVSPLNIDMAAKLVIRPISCSWNGCAATVNSWHILQKVPYNFAELFLSLITLIQYNNTDNHLAFAVALSRYCDRL